MLARLEDAGPVIAVAIGTWFFLIPLIGVTGAYIFRQLEHPERDYGHIRLWGTVGWVAANWCLTLWFTVREYAESDKADLSDSMRLGAVAAFVLAFYALTVPHAPINAETEEERRRSWLARLADAPLAALQMFRRPRSWCIACRCSAMSRCCSWCSSTCCCCGSWSVKDDVMPMYLTLSQTTEILCLALLPSLLARFGLKATMAAGGAAWTAGLALLSIGTPLGLVLSALPASGVFICCFVIAGQVFVNSQASADNRATAQGLLVLVYGSGLLLGHLLVGWIRDLSGNSYVIAYGVAAGLAAVLLVLFVAGFTTASPGRIPRRMRLFLVPK